MKYLLVAAHPDDEILGAGATVRKLTKEGHSAALCILCAKAEARAFRPEDDDLTADMKKSMALAGFGSCYQGPFPNIAMNTVPHLELVQFIENAILQEAPDVVITHHPADTNNDHLQTSLACQEAVRLWQRREGMHPVSELWFMEVPSATDWSVNTAMEAFRPNVFVEIGKEGVNAKWEALNAYRGVARSYPHPRSREALEGLAACRGAQAGCDYAEAFQCVLRRIL